MKAKIIELYLDYVNNFFTVTSFASHYGLSFVKGLRIIQVGRKLNAMTKVKQGELKTKNPDNLLRWGEFGNSGS